MNKKILIQYFLLFLIVLITFFIFYNYFYKNNENDITKKSTIDVIENKNLSNLISDLKYITRDAEGNQYEIISDSGEIDTIDQDIIFMKDVKAVIKLIDNEPILIESSFAKYNSKNNNTNFSEDIFIKHINHRINCQFMDLLFENNIANLYGDVVYTNLDKKILADKMEIDLITKNAKIFMYNKFKKVKITGLK